jgi:MATE family multidrug resistance protein
MVFSNVTTPLLGLVDTWVIGHLGQAWFLGGVSVGATFINLLFWLLGFLRMSTTGLTAQAQVQPMPKGSSTPWRGPWAWRSDWAWRCCSCCCRSCLPSSPSAAALPSTDLCRSICVGAGLERPGGLVQSGHHGVVAGHAGCSPMLLLILGNLINMVLDAWFVLGLGWQVKGVAAASLLADYSTLGVGFWLVSRHLRRLDPGCGTTPGSAGASGRPCCGCSP